MEEEKIGTEGHFKVFTGALSDCEIKKEGKDKIIKCKILEPTATSNKSKED